MSPDERTRYDQHVHRGPERRRHGAADEIAPVVLTRKYAEAIDGVDLVGHEVGDRLPLTSYEARLLIAEGWARPTAARTAEWDRRAVEPVQCDMA